MLICLFAAGTAIYTLFLSSVIAALVLTKDKRQSRQNPISIIIAARNEAANLPRLLLSLKELDYPNELFEIILVSDHSTDDTRQLVDQYKDMPQLRFLDFTRELPGLTGKKAAIQYGIMHARHDILVFTDADCEVPSTWLNAINSRFTEDTDYLLSYSVMRRKTGSGLMRLKNFERSIYYALAAAGLYYRKPITSSACNMAYRKSVFLQSDGFEGIGQIRSGDDDLLLMKMMPFIRKASFCADPAAQVTSYDGIDKAQHHQTNIRRASKFRYFPLRLKALAAFIFVYFIVFYIMLFTHFKGLPLGWILLKTALEFALSVLILAKAKRLCLLVLYPVQILIFPLQFVYYAIRGSLGKYKWK